MNKLSKIELYKHYQLIRNRRQKAKKVNYLKGLTFELQQEINNHHDKEVERFNRYLAEDLKKIEANNQDQNKIAAKYKLKIDRLHKNQSKANDALKIKENKINQKISNLNDQITKSTININHNEDRIIKLNNERLITLTKELDSKANLNEADAEIQAINYELNKLNAINILKNNEAFQLTVTNLKMFFGGIKAINDLSFYVKKGEIFGLIGPNGAGKTTVFNCVTQFYKPTSGNINFKNKEGNIISLTNLNAKDMITEGIARSFQNVELIWELTVLDNLMVAAHSLLVTNFLDHMLHSKKMKKEEQIIRTKGLNILASLGISEYAFRSPYGLPYGVLKKIELARTLMTDPSIIILDEPAAGLNDQETKDLALVIKKINQDLGVTIFLVEHDMGLVMSICDTVCAISFGKMLAIGTPKDIQNHPEVRKAYLGDDSDA